MSPAKGGHCVREILSIRIHSPSLVVVDIKGRAFLYHISPSLIVVVVKGRSSSSFSTSPSLIVVDIKGRAFLYHMVRLIVGALRLIGSGRAGLS
ncbi:hypothetical protein T484DRAFT_1823192 [Baffinella frigidus]|nr:hypothetical protein T484DRAFT_1823192 [Cryptophyta sp. CCMP2293]